MKIGIISDSHDHMKELKQVMEKLKDCEALIHCGDACAPFVHKELGNFNGPVHIVVGNNEGEQFHMMRVKPDNVTIYKPLAELEIAGKKIAITHYKDFADPLALTGKYDVVFYGHTHKKDSHKVNETLVLNPGDLMNLHGERGYAIYDTDTGEATQYDF